MFKKFICLLMIVLTIGSIMVQATETIPLPPTEDTKWQKSIHDESLVVAKVNTEINVPLYNQKDYPHVPYGNYGTVSTHGCGITCLAMVATYLLDTVYLPDELAAEFGRYNAESGSSWTLFPDSAKKLGLEIETQTWNFKIAKEALANGQVVICLQRKGYFTSGGHYIVLTGLTDDGKVLVNDPYGGNYTRTPVLVEGFANGFEDKYITAGGTQYWIYEKKVPQMQRILSELEKETSSSKIDELVIL